MAFSLQDYEILGEIGRGAFGTVLSARQIALNRVVAIKRIAPQSPQDRDLILRVRREAESLALLTHDNIVTVYDHAYHNGSYFLVMEYIDGLNLNQAISKGIPVAPSLQAIEKVVRAVKYAHSESIVHRDIKPENILLGRQGQVKLADFGLALFHRGPNTTHGVPQVAGSLCFMAPEALVTPGEADARSDIYSLGCLIYLILAGRLPFAAKTLGDISYQILHSEPEAIDTGKETKDLLQTSMNCLHKDRDRRPAIAEIQNSLKSTITAIQKSGQEDLITFVNRADANGPVLKSGHMPETRLDGEKASGMRRPALVWGGVVFVLMFSLLLIRHFRSGSLKSDFMPVPASSGNSSPIALGGPEAVGAVDASEAAPTPVTNTSLGLDQGTFILLGIQPGDTLFANEDFMKPQVEDGKHILKVKPGRYRLQVKRSGRVVFTYRATVMPYQKIVLDVAKGRIAEDG